jgi:hypothetical protein
MGNSSSLIPNNGENLYNLIKKEINDLVYKYEFWTDNRICDKLTFIYHDKLIQFRKEDLLNASVSIGIKQDIETDKNKMCNKIIFHYKDRITLLQKIWDAVHKGYKRIYMSKKGPVCQNVNKFVDNFFTCKEYKGLWLSEEQYKTVLENLKKYNLNNDQIKYIKDLNKFWIKCMKKLYNSIIIIKEDINNSIDNDSFIQLRDNINIVIKKMNYVSDIYYLLIINQSN